MGAISSTFIGNSRLFQNEHKLLITTQTGSYAQFNISSNVRHLTRIITTQMTDTDRQCILENPNILRVFIERLVNIPDKIFVCMAFMVHSFKWHVRAKDFENWINSKDYQPFPLNSNLCCYEAVIYAIFLTGLTTKQNLITSIPVLRIITHDADYLHLYRQIAIKYNVLTAKNCNESSIALNIQSIRPLLRFDNIYSPLGCAAKIKIIEKNMEQEKTNVCYCVDRYENITHVFLTHGDYAIELNSPTSSHVEILSLKQLVLKYKYKCEMEFCYFGNIETLVKNVNL